MKNSIAVVGVVALGCWCLLYGIPGAVGIAFGGWGNAPYAVLGLLGLVLIASRRRVAAWLVGGSEDDTRALAFAAIGAVGLLLVLSSLKELGGYVTYVISGYEDAEGAFPRWWFQLLCATAAAKFAAGLILMLYPAGIARALDSQPEDVPAAARIQAILFGAIALWVLVTDVPAAALGAYQVWSGKDDLVVLSYPLPETLAALARVLIATFVFIGRDRIAGWWGRVRPMAQG